MVRKKLNPPRPLATKSASTPAENLNKLLQIFNTTKKALIVKRMSKHPMWAATFLGLPLGLGIYLGTRENNSSPNKDL
jgi:hypothetical protein